MTPSSLALALGADAESSPPDAEPVEARVRRMVAQNVDALWRFMRRLGVEEGDLDDALQEVIWVTTERLGDIATTSERSFLFSTAFRVGSEHRRRRTRRGEVGEDQLENHQDGLPQPDSLTDQVRARALLDNMLEAMPTELRAVFTLYELEEMTTAEIATLLGLSLGTVKSRLRRAREDFEARIERLQATMRRKRCMS